MMNHLQAEVKEGIREKKGVKYTCTEEKGASDRLNLVGTCDRATVCVYVYITMPDSAKIVHRVHYVVLVSVHIANTCVCYHSAPLYSARGTPLCSASNPLSLALRIASGCVLAAAGRADLSRLHVSRVT